jgi:hypothetical protein
MPPTPRITTAVFRSLLLPPIRISVRTLASLHRPQCVPVAHTARPRPCLTQRRYLKLYKTARAKTTLGMHKVIPFELYKIAAPSTSLHKVNLVDGKHHDKVIAENITLQELYDEHIKPGHILYLTKTIPKNVAESVEKLKAEDTANTVKDFAIVVGNSILHNKKAPVGHLQLKTMPITLSSPVEYVRHTLDRAYQFVEHGSPVEFLIRLKGSQEKAEARLKFGDTEGWPYIHDHFPHLRPDFILRSMPEGSTFVIAPVWNGKRIQFVIQKKAWKLPLDLTKRLFKVKHSVQGSIKDGHQGMLPKVVREELAAGGSKDYTIKTGMPRPQAEALLKPDELETRWEFPVEGKDYTPPERRKSITHQKIDNNDPWEMGRIDRDDPTKRNRREIVSKYSARKIK